MSFLTLYLHGQGITHDIARAHCDWIQQTTGLTMTPLFYHDLVDDEPVSLFGLPLPTPLASTAEHQIATYLADLARADASEYMLGELIRRPYREIRRAHLFETYRSTMRYLSKRTITEQVLETLRQQIDQLAGGRTSAAPLSITLVAHSLGSVIGLDLMKSLPPDVRVERYISLGSPLGLICSLPKVISDYMVPPDQRHLTKPWFDVAVEGDALSMTQRITPKRNFSAEPLMTSTIYGEYGNPHESYFIDPEVAEAWTLLAR